MERYIVQCWLYCWVNHADPMRFNWRRMRMLESGTVNYSASNAHELGERFVEKYDDLCVDGSRAVMYEFG
jgi:hypothetical protein